MVETRHKPKGFFEKLLGRIHLVTQNPVDLDLGCLYELQNGQRGAIQAFGKRFGVLDDAPYIQLSGDERTGETEGQDETLTVNGSKWPEIKRIVLYIYIYEGASNWDTVKPQIQLRVPGQKPVVVTLKAHRDYMPICAIASLENIRDGIRLTTHLEYYPGHDAMDRAFGFGLEWEQGQKQP